MCDDQDNVARLIEELTAGKSVKLVAKGSSMRGRIEPGQVVTISPVIPTEVRVGDILLVRWRKASYIAHFVKEIRQDCFLISNTWGKVNGWVKTSDILGIVTDVSDH